MTHLFEQTWGLPHTPNSNNLESEKSREQQSNRQQPSFSFGKVAKPDCQFKFE